MSSISASVTLKGKGATNPALVPHDIPGAITVSHCNLVFSGNGFTHKIPLEHLDQFVVVYEYDGLGDTGRTTITVLAGLGLMLTFFGLHILVLIWFFWWRWTAIEVLLVATGWDEEYGINATTKFSLGKQKKYREMAPQIVQEIWRIRGDCRLDNKRRGETIYRQGTKK